MRATILILSFFMASMVINGQELTSDGDKYFYSYEYKEAIASYLNDKKILFKITIASI